MKEFEETTTMEEAMENTRTMTLKEAMKNDFKTSINLNLSQLMKIVDLALKDKSDEGERYGINDFLLGLYQSTKKGSPDYDEVEESYENIEAVVDITEAVINHDIVSARCDKTYIKILEIIDALDLFDMLESNGDGKMRKIKHTYQMKSLPVKICIYINESCRSTLGFGYSIIW